MSSLKNPFKFFSFPKLAKDSVYVVISQGILFISRFFWGILLARWLGVEIFGLYFYWVGIFAIVFALLEFGNIAYLLRGLNQSEDPENDFRYQINYVIRLFTSVLLICIFTAYMLRADMMDFSIALSSVLLIYIDRLFDVINTWFLKEKRAPFTAFLKVFRSAAVLAVGYLLFIIEIPSYYVLFVPAVFSLVNLLILFFQLDIKYGISLISILTHKLMLSDLKKIYKGLWVFGSLSLLSAISGNIDPIILKSLGFTEKDFGILGVAKKLIGAANMGGGAILNVLFPRLSKDYFTSPETFTKTFVKIFRPLLIIVLLLLSFLALFAETLIPLLFGSEYLPSVPYMYLFSLGFFVPVLMFLSSAMIAANAEKKVLWFNVFLMITAPAAKWIGVMLTDKYAIGYVEAIRPYISLVIFMVLLHRYFVPRLSTQFYLKTASFMIITLSIVIASPAMQISPYISFPFILVLLLMLNYLLSYAKVGELLRLKKKPPEKQNLE